MIVFRDFVESFFPFFPCSLPPSFIPSRVSGPEKQILAKSSKKNVPVRGNSSLFGSQIVISLFLPAAILVPSCNNSFRERPFSTEEMPLCGRLPTCKFKTHARVRGYPALFGRTVDVFLPQNFSRM